MGKNTIGTSMGAYNDNALHEKVVWQAGKEQKIIRQQKILMGKMLTNW